MTTQLPKDRRIRIILWCVVAVASYAFFVSVLLPPIVKWVAVDKLEEALGREISIGKIRLNPFSLSVTVMDFSLRQKTSPEAFITFDEFYINLQAIDSLRRGLTFKEVWVLSPHASIIRKEDGSFNFSDLLIGGKKTEGSETKYLFINSIRVINGSVDFTDHMPASPAEFSVRSIAFSALNFSTGKGNAVEISLLSSLGKEGSLSASGSFALDPREAHLQLDVKNFDLASLQPYVGSGANVLLTSGAASASGSLNVATSKGDVTAFNFSGQAFVRDLSVLDQKNGEEFLKWKELSINDMKLGTGPSNVEIGGMAVTGLYSRLIINPDGSLNANEVVKSREHEGEKEKIKQKVPVKVDVITIHGGTINFTDNNIKPNYSANLTEVSGRVSGLSSEKDARADVDLFAKFENYAPLEITGEIQPLSDDLYADLRASFKNMELGPLSPYSGKYAGYKIAKGKLGLRLDYRIEKRTLDAENTVFLDQFTFGERVKSPEATKLPVKLAVALLKNRRGEINLELPVTGSLDDPQFSVGRVILRIIVNLLKKVATAPFKFLGAFFGWGEEVSYLEFGDGSSELSGDNKDKVDQLVKALYERPKLELEIAGYVDRERDADALRQRFFDRKVKEQKRNEMLKEGQEAPAVDDIVVSKEEYEKYLTAAYDDADFPKPTTKLSVDEMERLMMAHTVVTEDDLGQLSSERAKVVYNYILILETIEPERVFLIEAESLSPKEKEDVRAARVEFRLR